MLLFKVCQASLLLASLASSVAFASTRVDHGMVEWAGIFDTPDSSYVWIAQKVDGGYDCPNMKLVALPVESASEESLEGVEEAGEEAIEAESCTVLNHGDTIIPVADTCYLLTFDDSRWETTFPIDASATSAIAFFAQHLPTEFEEDTHYLKLVSSGEDIEPSSGTLSKWKHKAGGTMTE